MKPHQQSQRSTGLRRSCSVLSITTVAIFSLALGSGIVSSHSSRADAQTMTSATAPWRGIEEQSRGDEAALAKLWWQQLQQHPDSDISQWVMLMWRRTFSRAAEDPIGVDAWLELLPRFSNGWTHRLASWWTHDMLLQGQRSEEVEALNLTEGSVRRWLGIGPFGDLPEVALHRTYPPQLHFDADAEYSFRRLTLKWRELVMSPRETRVFPSEQFARRGGVYYLRARFSVGEETDAIVQLATPGSLQLWIDGETIATLDRSSSYHPEVIRQGVQLRAGEHNVLVKGDGSSLAFLLRDTHGMTLDIENLDPWDSASGSGCRVSSTVQPIGLAIDSWLDAWREGELSDEKLLPLALYCSTEGDRINLRRILLDLEERGSEQPAVAMALLVERVASQLDFMPSDWIKNWRAGWRRQALAADPQCVPILLATASELRSEDRADAALEQIEQVLAVTPDSLDAWLMAEEIHGERQRGAARRRALLELSRIAPESPIVDGRWRRYWSELNRHAEVLEIDRRSYQRRRDIGTGRTLFNSLLRVGQTEAAKQILEQLEQRHADDLSYLQFRFTTLRNWDDNPGALATLHKIQKLQGDDPRWHAQEGDLLWEMQRPPSEIIRAYEKSLALQPGQVQLLRHLRHLRGEALDEFWKPYALDADEAIANAPPRDTYPQASAVYLIDHMVARVSPRGGREEMVHQVFRLDSAQAVQDNSTLSVPGEVLELRVITPEGEILQPTAGGSGGSYTLPGLTQGAIVEYRCLIRADLAEPRDFSIGPFYFRDPDSSAAFHLTELIALYPVDWDVTIEEKNMVRKRDEIVSSPEGDLRLLSWTETAMGPVDPEHLSPPRTEVIPNVHLWAPPEWELALEYLEGAGHSRGDAVTPDLERAAAEIIGDLSDRREQVQAIYDAVCDRVRDPRGGAGSATAVWISKSGPRDQLLAGLLRAAKIPYYYVLAAERDEFTPQVNWEIANPGLFQIAMLSVPMPNGDPIYMTAQQRLAPLGAIPRSAQGGRAVRISGDGIEWIRLPLRAPDCIAQEIDLEFELAATGPAARVQGEFLAKQLGLYGFKESLLEATASQRGDWLDGFVQRFFPGNRSRSKSFPDLEQPGHPFNFKFDIAGESLLQSVGGDAALKVQYFPVQMRTRFVRDAERTLPLWSTTELLFSDEYNIDLGEFQVRELPQPLSLSGPWGSYSFDARLIDGQVELHRRVHLQPFQLQPAEYKAFLQTCTQIDRKEEERLRLSAAG